MPRVVVARSRVPRTVVRALIVAALVAGTVAGVAGCGQRGPLYYPDTNNPDRRR